MKRFGWVIGCALLLGIGSRGTVQAQQRDEELTRDWIVRVGLFMPTDEEARDAKGNVWFTAGVERPVYEVDRWRGTFGIDYYGAGTLYCVPITLNIRGNSQGLRYGGGLGLGLSHDLSRGMRGVAYNLLVGYDILGGGNPLTADLRFMGLTTGNGQLNGFALTLGYRF